MPKHSSQDETFTKPSQSTLWEELAQLAPPGQKELFDKLLEQSQFYFALTDNPGKEGMQQTASQKENNEPNTRAKGNWDLVQTMFGRFSHCASQPGMPPVASSELSRLFGLPSADTFKNQTELFNEFAKQAEQLQATQSKLTDYFKKLDESALSYFNAEKRDNTSPQERYSSWVECGEKAFSDLSQNDQFIEAQSSFVNALTKIDSLKIKMAEPVFQQFGIMSQQELASIHKNLHELKRELRQKNRKQEQEIMALKKELHSLKKESPRRTKQRK